AETMFPLPIGLDEEYTQVLKETAALCGVPMLIGALSATPSENEIRRYDIFNSAYYLDANGDILNRYDKRHLVPISEYVPFRDTRVFYIIRAVVTALSELRDVYGMLEGANIEPFVLEVKHDAGAARSDASTKMQSAPNTAVTASTSRSGANEASGRYKYGVQICYESIFPELTAESVKRGADFIINISNDGWFKDSSELEQILAISAFRAVENKTTFVRATNTGISAVIQPSGRIDVFSGQNGRAKEVQGAWIKPLPVSGQKGTFYTRTGDYFPYLCMLISVVIIILKYLKILDSLEMV
ncbi:MAG: apolipoprotein N-acyltransferase, partial [Planctomycetota bacterium]